MSTRKAVDWHSFCCEVTMKWFEREPGAHWRPEHRSGNRWDCHRKVEVWTILEALNETTEARNSSYHCWSSNIQRSAEELAPIIQKYVIPGSVIYSDMWKAYDSLSTLGYQYHKINHSDRFVEGQVHSQNIERLWRDLKEWIQKPGMTRPHL